MGHESIYDNQQNHKQQRVQHLKNSCARRHKKRYQNMWNNSSRPAAI